MPGDLRRRTSSLEAILGAVVSLFLTFLPSPTLSPTHLLHLISIVTVELKEEDKWEEKEEEDVEFEE